MERRMVTPRPYLLPILRGKFTPSPLFQAYSHPVLCTLLSSLHRRQTSASAERSAVAIDALSGRWTGPIITTAPQLRGGRLSRA